MIWLVLLLSWKSSLVDFFEKFVIAVTGLYGWCCWCYCHCLLCHSLLTAISVSKFSVASCCTCRWTLAKSNIDVIAVDCCFFNRSFVRLLLQLRCCCQCSSLFATHHCSLTKPCCLHCAALCRLLGLIVACFQPVIIVVVINVVVVIVVVIVIIVIILVLFGLENP